MNIGDKLFIRTVTYHLVGEIEEVIIVADKAVFWKLKDASWVADSGRFMQAIKDGKLSEVEPVGAAFVNVAAITDAFPWDHDLPLKQK